MAYKTKLLRFNAPQKTDLVMVAVGRMEENKCQNLEYGQMQKICKEREARVKKGS